MGTKADFYLGHGHNACWLGSIAWDGHPWKIPQEITNSKTEEEYRFAVKSFLNSREDASHGSSHWPWPWPNSHKTHYSYTFIDGNLLLSHYGGPWIDPADPQGWKFPINPKQDFPDMKDRRLSIIGERSGLVVVNDTAIEKVVHNVESTDEICS